MNALTSECDLCPIKNSWCFSINYLYINQAILTTDKFAIRAACKIKEFYYVVYDNQGRYAYHKHFKTLDKTISHLIIRLTTLSLEETLMLTKFKIDLENLN